MMLDDVTVTGADELTRDLRTLADRSSDLRPLWGQVADMFVQRQKDVFTSGRLAPLAPESVRRKRVHKTEPMVGTGALRQATYRYSPIKSTNDRASFGIPKGGTRKSIGAMHAVASGSRPKRDVVPNWSKAERLKILDMLSDYLMRGL